MHTIIEMRFHFILKHNQLRKDITDSFHIYLMFYVMH